MQIRSRNYLRKKLVELLDSPIIFQYMVVTKGRKPLNIQMCEIVYTAVVFERIHTSKSTKKTIMNFIEKSKTFKYGLQEGGLFNEFIADIRAHNMQHPD